LWAVTSENYSGGRFYNCDRNFAENLKGGQMKFFNNMRSKPMNDANSYLLKSRDQKVVAAAIMLLEKICKCSLVSPPKIKAISKVLKAQLPSEWVN
jgi:hypothetical protein